MSGIDQIELLLASLLCAEATGEDNIRTGDFRGSRKGASKEECDAGAKLRFDPMRPKLAYTVQGITDDSGERLYAVDPALLLSPVQDLLGSEAECALVVNDRVKWTGFRRVKKAPRGVWVSAPGATLYEYHYREIFPSGDSTYFKRFIAISKRGRAVPCVIVGSTGGESTPFESQQAVLAASVIEDSLRPDAFRATIKDSVAICLPVPQGEHLELFRLRDGPYSGSRRKALIHWVASHIRRTPTGKFAEVKDHLRGVREFEIDGLGVKLEAAP